MRDPDLLQLALGIALPWFVKTADFNAELKRLDIRIDFKAGVRFACCDCGADGCPVHDTSEKTWQHLDFFQLSASGFSHGTGAAHQMRWVWRAPDRCAT